MPTSEGHNLTEMIFMNSLVQETTPGRWMSVISPSLPSLGYQDMHTCWLQPWLHGGLILILQTLSSPMESLEPRTTTGHSAHDSLIVVRPEIARHTILGLKILTSVTGKWWYIINKIGEIENKVLWAVMWRIQHGAHSLLKSRRKTPSSRLCLGKPTITK